MMRQKFRNLLIGVVFASATPLGAQAVDVVQGQSCEQNLGCDMRKSNLAFSARATATSTLQNSNRYAPANVLDKSPEAGRGEYWGNPETAWCEGAPGLGIEETIRIDFTSPQPIAVVNISAGYEKSLDLYKKNARIREAYLLLSDGSRYRLVFDKHFYDFMSLRQSWKPMKTRSLEMNSPQMFAITSEGEAPRTVDWLELTILKADAGLKYTDTCISRIEIAPKWSFDF